MTGLEYFAFCIGVSAKRTPLCLQFGLDFLIGRLESFAFRVGVLLFQPIGMLSATGLLRVSHGSVWKKAFQDDLGLDHLTPAIRRVSPV